MNSRQVEALLYQTLEVALGSERVFEAALKAASNKVLHEEWRKHLARTRLRQKHLLGAFPPLELDPKATHPIRELVKAKTEFVVTSIHRAIDLLDPEAAQNFAGECVIEAEDQDHLNWTLLEQVSRNDSARYQSALSEPVTSVLTEESHLLFHTHGSTREFWIKRLGVLTPRQPPAVLSSVEGPLCAGLAEQLRYRLG